MAAFRGALALLAAWPAPARCLSSPAASDSIKAVVIKRGKARLFRDGNPLVYSGAVASVDAGARAGDLVRIVDGVGTMLGWGAYNPQSMFRVRVLELGADAMAASAPGHGLLGGLLRRRLASALALRTEGLGLPGGAPGEETTVFRWVNGEGDRLSGVVVDVLGDRVVVSASALWVEVHRPTVEGAVADVAREGLGEGYRLIWRRTEARLKQDGWMPPDAHTKGGDGQEGAAEEGEEEVVVKELGLTFVAGGPQKTGYYADQRENRRLVRRLVAARRRASGSCRVLDLFCHTGAFALNAMAGGATEVVGVDSSAACVTTAERNAAVNGWVPGTGPLRFVKAEAAAYLRHARGEEEGAFDVVVCDPPKLAPSVRALDKALRKYRALNAGAMALVRPGGLLLSCSCSGAVARSPGLFVQALQSAAGDAGRGLRILRVGGAAEDHPVHPMYPEGGYLTAVLAVVTGEGD